MIFHSKFFYPNRFSNISNALINDPNFATLTLGHIPWQGMKYWEGSDRKSFFAHLHFQRYIIWLREFCIGCNILMFAYFISFIFLGKTYFWIYYYFSINRGYEPRLKESNLEKGRKDDIDLQYVSCILFFGHLSLSIFRPKRYKLHLLS